MANGTLTRVKAKTAQVVAQCPQCENGTMHVTMEADLQLGSGPGPRTVTADLDRSSVLAGLTCDRCDFQQLVTVADE